MNDHTTPVSLTRDRLDLEVQGISLSVLLMRRDGTKAPIVFLHGFGSTGEDFADIIRYRGFDGHAVVAYDAPGCGETSCEDPSVIDIPFLAETAERLIARFAPKRFHLVGHSMGGLTALKVAQAIPDSLLSFTNIEGNLAPEDCFLSRQILRFEGDDPSDFFEQFIERIWQSGDFAAALYASRLRHNVDVRAVPAIFRSMVELSERGGLFARFTELPCPRLFMHGESNRDLSYLDTLREAGVELCEIPRCGHFPMYSNPPAMWRGISDFIGGAERENRHG